jgi:hypothetical protein
MTTGADFDTFLREIGVENGQKETALKSLDIVVLTVVHVATQIGCEPEFEFNLSNIIGIKGDDGRVVYPTLSFSIRGCASALRISIVPLFEENATIHAMWNEKITDTRKVTTLHLNPKPYTNGRTKGLVSQIRTVLFSPIVDVRQQARLQTLPDPLLLLVLTFLSPKEVCRSGQSCQRLKEVYRHETVWQPRCGGVLDELRGLLDQKRLRRRSRWGPMSVGTVLVPPSAVLTDKSDRPSYEVYRAAATEIKVRVGGD